MTNNDINKPREEQGPRGDSADVALQRRAERLTKLHAEARKSDLHGLKARWEAGNEVAEVMADERRYGRGSVERLAEQSPWSASTLYDLAKVARWKSWEELESSHSKSSSDFSISHLFAIARPSMERAGEEVARAIRETLFLELVEKGLSARQLQDRMDELLRTHAQAAADDPEADGEAPAPVEGLGAASEEGEQNEQGQMEQRSPPPSSPKFVTLRHANSVIAAALELSESSRSAWDRVRAQCMGTLGAPGDRAALKETITKARVEIVRHQEEILRVLGEIEHHVTEGLGDAPERATA